MKAILYLLIASWFLGCTPQKCIEIARQDECKRLLNNEICGWDNEEKLCKGKSVTASDCPNLGQNACEQAFATCSFANNACTAKTP